MNWNPETYRTTYRFAADAHGGQQYPGTQISYLMHLSFVCMEVMAALAHHPDLDGNLAIQCALLHDVIEDTSCDYAKVAAEFGTAVADGVQALTKRPDLDKPVAMADSLQRIQRQPYEVWLVKMADRISNLAPPPHHWNQEKIIYYRQEAKQIYKALHPASAYLANRLNEKIEAYQAYLK